MDLVFDVFWRVAVTVLTAIISFCVWKSCENVHHRWLNRRLIKQARAYEKTHERVEVALRHLGAGQDHRSGA